MSSTVPPVFMHSFMSWGTCGVITSKCISQCLFKLFLLQFSLLCVLYLFDCLLLLLLSFLFLLYV